MKRFIMRNVLGLALLVLASGVCRLGYAAPSAGDQGLGVIVGSPTGLSGKLWLNNAWAMDGVFGVAHNELDVAASFLFHDYRILKQIGLVPKDSTIEMPFYMGAGARVLFEDETEFGIRLPLGVSVFPQKTNWEFFGEFAPVVRLTPSVGLNADFGLGLRYYFLAIRPKESK